MTQKVDKKQQEEKSDGKGGIRFGTGVAYDDAYAGGSHNGEEEYVTALPTLDEERKLMSDDYDNVRGRELEELDDAGQAPSGGGRRSSTWKTTEDEIEGENYNPFKDAEGGSGKVNTRIADRESDYHKRKLNRTIREDGMSYKDTMKQALIEKERYDLVMEAKKDLLDEEGNLKQGPSVDDTRSKLASSDVDNPSSSEGDTSTTRRRRRRWDDADGSADVESKTAPAQMPPSSAYDASAIVSDTESITARQANKSRWDESGGTS